MSGISITGINETLFEMDGDNERIRQKVLRTCKRVGEDLLKKGRDYAPIDTAMLADSGTNKVTDNGAGAGIVIEVKFDTPYALRMHEDHYQAHDPQDPRGKNKYYTRIGKKYVEGALKNNPGMKSDVEGYWVDANGNKHGRKYLERAEKENRERYIKQLESCGDGK